MLMGKCVTTAAAERRIQENRMRRYIAYAAPQQSFDRLNKLAVLVLQSIVPAWMPLADPRLTDVAGGFESISAAGVDAELVRVVRRCVNEYRGVCYIEGIRPTKEEVMLAHAITKLFNIFVDEASNVANRAFEAGTDELYRAAVCQADGLYRIRHDLESLTRGYSGQQKHNEWVADMMKKLLNSLLDDVGVDPDSTDPKLLVG